MIFSGLDPREYAYATFDHTLVLVGTHTFACEQQWLVHRIQAFAGANASTINVGTGDIPIAANGCVVLEPNGLLRRNITASGLGLLVIVEFFFQATAGGAAPTVTVT
jgi:hypothetical protein